jgi:2-oxoglutarate/2-oxoacid ferredoxin oxidoreductase subunit alpha
MIERALVKGNEALAIGSLKAGLNAYFAYPITPSTELPETLAREFGNPEYPEFKVFLQAASELEAVNMTMGAACTGSLAMTATSSPGFSLKQEAISYAAGMEVPFVVVNVNRGGPGLGNLGVEQSDYFQSTKGGGHGGYQLNVLAPNSVQEMLDFPRLAFQLAFEYRNPVIILADAFLGQLKEDVLVPSQKTENHFDRSWATLGSKNGVRHIMNSLHLESDAQEAHENRLHEKYRRMMQNPLFESLQTDDASVVLVSYGITSRICKKAVSLAREEGLKLGLLRPITLNPFPTAPLKAMADDGRKFLVVELNAGQMIQDVKLAVEGKTRVEHLARLGGNVPSAKEIIAKCREMTN